MSINYVKYAEEGHQFAIGLAAELGHPEEVSRTGILLRERLTIPESLISKNNQL